MKTNIDDRGTLTEYNDDGTIHHIKSRAREEFYEYDNKHILRHKWIKLNNFKVIHRYYTESGKLISACLIDHNGNMLENIVYDPETGATINKWQKRYTSDPDIHNVDECPEPDPEVFNLLYLKV